MMEKVCPDIFENAAIKIYDSHHYCARLEKDTFSFHDQLHFVQEIGY